MLCNMSSEGRTSLSFIHEQGLRIAVEGCCHGELDKIYECIQNIEKKDGRKIDLLICCGDFQAIRNKDDLECMACPPKYRHLGTFWKYYSGEKIAPYLTLFIGGNHEAINYLWELYYGGWVAPKIYFMGYAGVIWFGGLRIAGLSGIFKQQHYNWGHWEAPPYSESSMRSAYHVRHLDVNKLLRLSGHVDIIISHDWPSGIAYHGNLQQLLQRKKFLKREIEDGSLGSPPAAQLLQKLKPSFWFSAHLHTKFTARVNHPDGQVTQFTSLDKCLPGRQFLQVVDFPKTKGEKRLSYDPEWLAITKSTHQLFTLQRTPPPLPVPEPVSTAQVEAMEKVLKEYGANVPDFFERTVDPHIETAPKRGKMPCKAFKNPQTTRFLKMLDLTYSLEKRCHEEDKMSTLHVPKKQKENPQEIQTNPEEIDLDSD